MAPDRLPAWQHSDTGLMIQVGQRRDPLPDPIGDWLVGPEGLGLSGDPARDLLGLEGQLRHMVAQLSREIVTAERRISATRGEDARPHPSRRRRSRPADRERRAALDVRADLVNSRESARTVLEILRTYVMELNVPHGLLREAADGWRRLPDPPPGVVVFDDEDTFLDTDPRRGTDGGWGGTTIAGIEQLGPTWRLGLTWRRDGDETADDPAVQTPDDERQRAGPWQVGYIVRTGEVYAIRRCGFLPRQVWLLGKGFDAPRAVQEVLRPILPRITEPNSVVLAAGTVHAAQTWPPRPPSPHGESGGPTRTSVHMPEEAGQ